jgi:hypothetical protein
VSKSINSLAFTCLVAGMLAAGAPAQAQQTVFLDAPTGTSTVVSRHSPSGPVLADDFQPAASGPISSVTWWGSELPPSPGGQIPFWELAFHTNAPAGEPNIDNSTQGALVKYLDVVVNGSPTPIPGIFRYTVDLTGLTGEGEPFMTVLAGTEYWFTVASYLSGWTWADALLSPTIGNEQFAAHESIGAVRCPDVGPHCGPWIDQHTDLAFAVTVIPEPGTYALMLAGLSLTGLASRHRSRKVSR